MCDRWPTGDEGRWYHLIHKLSTYQWGTGPEVTASFSPRPSLSLWWDFELFQKVLNEVTFPISHAFFRPNKMPSCLCGSVSLTFSPVSVIPLDKSLSLTHTHRHRHTHLTVLYCMSENRIICSEIKLLTTEQHHSFSRSDFYLLWSVLFYCMCCTPKYKSYSLIIRHDCKKKKKNFNFPSLEVVNYKLR